MQEQYRKTNEAIKNAANVQMAVALHTVIIGLGVRKLAVSDGLADLTGNELLSSRGRALVNREQELHIAQKVLCELLVKECRGRWCKTMDRPASSCGCPDCGSSLIDFPSKATPEAAPSLISSLKSILADADVGPPTDSDGCCRECGQWTPWRHPESHDHEDGCTAPREYAKRRDWKSRLSALISNTPAAVQTHAEAAAALGINSALTRIQAGNHAEAIEPLEHALRVLAATPAATAPVVLPEPALHVSGGQLERHCDPEDKNGGRYIPARKTAAGLFTTPLYTEQQVRALLAHAATAAAPAYPAEGMPTDLHAAIMNIPMNKAKLEHLGINERLQYKIGHRDARHDAAELAVVHASPQAQADARDAEITWPKARDVGRIGDMSQVAHIRVGFDSDNDVFVSVWDENGGGSIEFCNPGGGGGGQSSRTRIALIALMVAMEADNAEKPSRDWWAQRAAIATAKGEQQS